MRTISRYCFRLLFVLLAGLQAGVIAADDAPEKFREVSFRATDGGTVFANVYGDGKHAVVLAHGAVFDKESWHDQAVKLAKESLQVVAIDFRGYGKSKPGSERGALHLDVLAAIRFLKQNGAERVSVVGGSMGGGAAARAAVESNAGDIDRLILLAHSPTSRPEKLKGRKLFIVSRGDGSRRSVERQYAAAAEPKKLVILDGNAHAQHIFRTQQGEELMKHMINWLNSNNGEL